MRQNAPRLIDPRNAIVAATDRQLGIVSDVVTLERVAEIERQLSLQGNEIARLRSLLGDQPDRSYGTPQILSTRSLKGAMTATNITSTTGTTVTNSNVGPLIAGIPYLVIAYADMAMNAPSGQTIYSCVRIQATGTTVDGTQTTTVGGERWGSAVDFKVVLGTGVSINVAGRSRVTGGTGTINDAISTGIAIPLGAMIEVW